MKARITLEVGDDNRFGIFTCESFQNKKVDLGDFSSSQELNLEFLRMVEKAKGSLDESGS